jgi:hypothetical protein
MTGPKLSFIHFIIFWSLFNCGSCGSLSGLNPRELALPSVKLPAMPVAQFHKFLKSFCCILRLSAKISIWFSSKESMVLQKLLPFFTNGPLSLSQRHK